MATGNEPRLMLQGDELVFSFPAVDPSARFRVSFQRTLRVPDDGTTYPLPDGLGRFPVERVEDSELPEWWQKRGGVFLPMYSSEAMWICFGGSYPMAVKIAAGKINAVNGKPWTESLATRGQDYIVGSRQPWLDGFNVGRGCVRQFVATKLGDGRSVEEQLTGDAEYGGIQILLFPMKRERWDEHRKARAHLRNRVPVVSAVASMTLGMGGRIKQEIEKDRWGRDAWDMTQKLRVFVHLVHAKDYSMISSRPVPPCPITPEDYKANQLPWFDWDSGEESVEPGDGFGRVKSVSTQLRANGIAPLGDKPIEVSNIVHLPMISSIMVDDSCP